jgi:selenocysteine lyase/cysteine desulfurase
VRVIWPSVYHLDPMSTLSLESFRGRFPLLSRRVYVNSCSQGALSIDVEEAMSQFLESWHDRGSPWDAWVSKVETLRAAFARAIGADAGEVAIVPSASAGISSVASALSFDGPRRRVAIGAFEFPTMAHVWLAQERRGAEMTWVPADGHRMPTEQYDALIDERTLVVPATHVCFKNGYRLDIAGLTKICHDRGAYLFLDDYQHTGTSPLDVHALGVDFMVTGALKYLTGPSGVAFLYVRKGLVGLLEPTVTGWFGRIDPFAFRQSPLDWAGDARRLEVGTPTVPNAYGALAGLDLLALLGAETIGRQIESLCTAFIDGARREGWDVLTPSDSARRGPLCVVRSHDAAELVRRLESRGVLGSARGNGLRISFHAYNAMDDVNAVLAALRLESVLIAGTHA